jgi:hypothetical protein
MLPPYYILHLYVFNAFVAYVKYNFTDIVIYSYSKISLSENLGRFVSLLVQLVCTYIQCQMKGSNNVHVHRRYICSLLLILLIFLSQVNITKIVNKK